MRKSTVGPLDITFTATTGRVQDGDTWTCVKLPDSDTIFATRGLIKVSGTVDGDAFHGAFMAPAMAPTTPDRRHNRKTIGKTDGDDIIIHLQQRLS